MCGIAGFAGVPSDKKTLNTMLKAIAHRGPDDIGTCVTENIAIGMTRLSIVDINGGAQPIHSSNGRFSIVFNGEIYNYPALANTHIKEGGQLFTRSDTEIILVLYEKLREKCLEKLRGMFSFAIIDRHEQSIFIARDRVGIKPLYYWQKKNLLIFASEIKALLASQFFSAEANISAITHYLSRRYLPNPHSLFQGVKQLPPGHWMKWQSGKTTQQCYWRPHITEKQNCSTQALQEQFDIKLRQSIDIHCMSDVPYGAYLSGGIDSTAVASLLTERNTSSINTFTIGFGWHGDEFAQARETAKQLGTIHHEVICGTDEIEQLPNMIWHADEPLGDPIIIPTYALARAASQHVKVILTGDGADEILGGYLFHKSTHMAMQYKQFVPNFIHDRLVMPLIQKTPVHLINKAFQYPGYLGIEGKKRLLTFLQHARSGNPALLMNYFTTLFDEKEKMNLFHDKSLSAYIEDSTHQGDLNNQADYFDQMIHTQFNSWLPDNILMRQDKMAMAHGLEARVPFLDHELIEFMASVPNHLKLSLWQNKKLLRQIMKKNQLVTAAKRKKNAFYFPMEIYFKNKIFQEIIASTLSEEQIKKRGLFKATTVTQLLKRAQQQEFLAAKQIFSLISLELWFQVFIDQPFSKGT